MEETYQHYNLDLRHDGVCVLYDVIDPQLIKAARDKVDDRKAQAILQEKTDRGCVAFEQYDTGTQRESQGWCKEFEDVYEDFCKVYGIHVARFLFLKIIECIRVLESLGGVGRPARPRTIQ